MIRLVPVGKDNWRECLKLEVAEEQKHFVGRNVQSLAMAYVYKEQKPHVIYNDDEMVGFLMYAVDPDEHLPYVNRLMIDKKYQGKGYGTEALKVLIDLLRSKGYKLLDILHKSDNYDAIRMYDKLGFKRTEEKVGGDVVSRLDLANGS